jgi:RNA-directed DNA polymerase
MARRLCQEVWNQHPDNPWVRLYIARWLKAPVEERDAQGKQRTIGGKTATRGTPQGGVASPLLANIYMHRFIKAFRLHDLETRYRAELVTYADDCAPRRRREEAAM